MPNEACDYAVLRARRVGQASRVRSADAAIVRVPNSLAATLPVVISDTDAVYLYGLDIIAEQLAGAERYYYVHDGLGSVRQLLDSGGQIETKYTYDPVGVPLARDGVPNPWHFTGDGWDGGVELLYLRARYYQPETGRLVMKDPWAGERQSPGTLDRYLYVKESPMNHADPRGLNGGGPEGYCPEAKECFHPLEIRWPFGSRDRECPEKFHEWVRHWQWPDPWGDEPLGSPKQEYVTPLREVLIPQAEKMYEKYVGLKTLEAIARSRTNNPLTAKLLEPGCLGGTDDRQLTSATLPHPASDVGYEPASSDQLRGLLPDGLNGEKRERPEVRQGERLRLVVPMDHTIRKRTGGVLPPCHCRMTE